MQGRTQYKFVQIPSMTDELLCPVTALRRLLNSRHLSPNHPLFAHTDAVGIPVIDTQVSDSLKQVLAYLKIPKQGHTFHAFRRSGPIVAFGSHVNLEDIKAHGNWRSDAIFEYLRSDLAAPPAVPRAFQSLL